MKKKKKKENNIQLNTAIDRLKCIHQINAKIY